MEPKEVRFCVYADDDQQVRDLQQALYDFVNSYYKKGILIPASKLTKVVRQFQDSPLIKTFLTK